MNRLPSTTAAPAAWLLAIGTLVGVAADGRLQAGVATQVLPSPRDRILSSCPMLTPQQRTDVDRAFGRLDTLTTADVAHLLQWVSKACNLSPEDVKSLEDDVRKQPDTMRGDLERLRAEVADLKAELAALKSAPPPAAASSPAAPSPAAPAPAAPARPTQVIAHRVTAPFEVVDARGKVILRVAEQWSAADDVDGGTVIVNTSDRAGVMVRRQSGAALTLLAGPNGGYVGAHAKGVDAPVLTLSAAARSVSVYDLEGKVRATMQASDDAGQGLVAVLSPTGATLSGIGVNGAGGRVFANALDGMRAFIGGALPNGDADACAFKAKGLRCLSALPLTH